MANKSRRPRVSAHTAGLAAIGAAAIAGVAVVASLFWQKRNRDAKSVPLSSGTPIVDEYESDFTVAYIDGGEAAGDARDVERAPDAFRPDHDARIPADKRDAFAPATMAVDAR